MIDTVTPANIFRFIQLRPPVPVRQANGINPAATQDIDAVLTAANDKRGAELRERFGKQNMAQLIDRLAHRDRLAELADASETVEDFHVGSAQLRNTPAFEQEYAQLRNGWFASYAGAINPVSDALEHIAAALKLYAMAAEVPSSSIGRMTPAVARTMPLIMGLCPKNSTNESKYANVAAKSTAQTLATAPPSLAATIAALQVLQDVPHFVQTGDAKQESAKALNAKGKAQLSAAILDTISAIGMNVADPLHELLAVADAKVKLGLIDTRNFSPAPGWGTPAGLASDGRVKPAGVADLLVVKQHVKRYEPIEIAHVENVMQGETRRRTHRVFDRREEVLIEERQSERETTEDLETAERNEMNREVSNTLQNDRKLGLQLSLSGKYGPTVEFSTNASMESSTSEQQASKSASEFAREVMSKSTERILEKQRSERRLTMLRETEENNLHEFANGTAEHIIGQYQYLEKVCENQVFNYGKRLMFDFMVPEPAAYLWHLRRTAVDEASMPQPPVPLAQNAADASQVTELNYRALAALYSAEAIEPPPPVTATVQHKLGGDGAAPTESEEGQPRKSAVFEITLPDHYRATKVEGTIMGITDDYAKFVISVADDLSLSRTMTHVPFPNGYKFFHDNFELIPPYVQSPGSENKLVLHMMIHESASNGIALVVRCDRTPRALELWQLKTYEALRLAYVERMRDYEQALSRAQSEAQQRGATNVLGTTPYGDSPRANQMVILQELKKLCIAILTRQHFERFGSITDAPEPRIRFAEAMAEGKYIRFFEQAFEWDQVQYVFYPYFWAGSNQWENRFAFRDNDMLFQEFMRAGEARVMLPTRQGFERAMNYFLTTGRIWQGEGDPPLIGEDLYVSIITEIEERTGLPEDEVPVGAPWESRLPTTLVTLRGQDTLPRWTNTAEDGWDWRPEPDA